MEIISPAQNRVGEIFICSKIKLLWILADFKYSSHLPILKAGG